MSNNKSSSSKIKEERIIFLRSLKIINLPKSENKGLTYSFIFMLEDATIGVSWLMTFLKRKGYLKGETVSFCSKKTTEINRMTPLEGSKYLVEIINFENTLLKIFKSKIETKINVNNEIDKEAKNKKIKKKDTKFLLINKILNLSKNENKGLSDSFMLTLLVGIKRTSSLYFIMREKGYLKGVLLSFCSKKAAEINRMTPLEGESYISEVTDLGDLLLDKLRNQQEELKTKNEGEKK